MPRPVRLIDLATVAVRTRRLGELMLSKCRCGRTDCTIAEHVWRSTKDMAAGPRALATDLEVGGWKYEEVTYPDGTSELLPIAKDSVGEAAVSDEDAAALAHAEYRRLLTAFDQAADDLDVFLSKHRPDRTIHEVTKTSATDWCTNHLEGIGTCEPRYRGDLCRFCYSATLVYGEGVVPPATLLRMRHEGTRISQAVFDEYMTAMKRQQSPKKKRRKRKAS